jgi:non-specific serine/threonine protein kinase
LTQEELAELAGVSARLISDLERGLIHRPRRDTIQMLADGLRLSGAERDDFVETARGRTDALVPAGPAPAGATARHANLPLPPAALVGREREVAATTSLLLQSEVRLLTLTGPGGVGKTRLALEVAAKVSNAFTHGVAFVDLAPVTEPARVIPAIAQALGVRDRSPDGLIAALADMRLLVLLDNVEHLIAAAPALAHLIELCPALTLLATSRQPLHLRAEWEYPVTPLALPDLRELPAPGELGRIPAIDLFVRRAESARHAFALTPDNARAIAEVAVRLDGLPLAIELAAARVKVLSPAQLLARLEPRLPLLTGGAQDLPARQQTMRATIDWSHGLLTPAERRLFRRMAVFSGGFTLDAAEYVGAQPAGDRHHAAEPAPTVLDELSSLVDKSLLRGFEQEQDHGNDPNTNAPRFGMLETIREYGLESLAAAGEEEDARVRHAAWCLELAERAAPELTGPDQQHWLTYLESEHDNLRAALGWAMGRRDAETAMRLGGAMHRFWDFRGHYAEGRRWLEQALALDNAKDVSPPARAKALMAAGALAHFQGDYERALELETAALELYRLLEDLAGIAATHRYLGMVARAQRDYERATALDEEALRLYHVVGDLSGVNAALNNLGLTAWICGDYDRAAVFLDEALALARRRGTNHSAAIALSNLSLVAQARRDYESASARQAEALELYRLLGSLDGLAHCYENFALIAAARDQHERAARLSGAAAALRARIGAPGRPSDRDFNERRFAVTREQLGADAFTAARQHGARMSLDEANAYALEVTGDR